MIATNAAYDFVTSAIQSVHGERGWYEMRHDGLIQRLLSILDASWRKILHGSRLPSPFHVSPASNSSPCTYDHQS